MSRTAVKKEYSLEDAPEEIKHIIIAAQAGECSELMHDEIYALYSERPSGRRHIIPAKYDSEEEKFLSKKIFTYNPDKKRIRVRDTAEYIEDVEMVPKSIPEDEDDFESLGDLLESN